MPMSPARRATIWRDYKDLCVRYSEPRRGRHWWPHYRELRERVEPRLTKAELKCWWTERFTRDEIRAMASAIDFLSSEQVAA